MKRTIAMALLASLVPVINFGQSGAKAADTENVRDLAANDATMTIRTFDNRYQGIKGHPYLHKDWLLGELITTEGYRYKDVKLKYNIHRDEVSLMRKATSEVIVLFNENIVSFVIAGTPFKTIKDQEGSQFYEILVGGDHALLVRRKKNLLKADFEGAYSAGRTSDEFVEGSTDYYIQSGDQLPIKIKLNPKSVAQALGLNDKQVKAYIKTNRLDIKEEEDLIKLMSHYSS